MTTRHILLIVALSACAPSTATLQTKCAGFGYTTITDIAGCTERRHDKAIDRQFAAARVIASVVSVVAIADALASMKEVDG